MKGERDTFFTGVSLIYDMWLLMVIALLPAIVLCAYVFKKDRAEKEPFGLLLKLFVLGALSCIPVAIVEIFAEEFMQMFFSEAAIAEINTGDVNVHKTAYYIYTFADNFLCVALIEELAKFALLIRITGKSKEFNSSFDGLIYAVFVSLGFAAFENVMYVLENGVAVGITRAVLSVPGDMFFGVMMGYFYSMWHITDKAAFVEENLISRGVITSSQPRFNSTRSKIMCLLMPVTAHGLYDFCCTVGTALSMIILMVIVIAMYVRCFATIRKMSVTDAPETDYVRAMISQKYFGTEIPEEL